MPTIQSLCRQFFDEQKQVVLARLPDVSKGLTRAQEPLFDIEADTKKLVALLINPIKEEIGEAGVEAALMVGFDGFNLIDPAIAQFVADRTERVSSGVNKETDKQIRAELAEGLSQGEGIDELAARIEKVYGAAAGYRAERIARTETIRAENFASQESWRQSGVVEAKEWYTAHDERVCQFCKPMDGRVVGLEARFFDKGETFTGNKGGTLKLDFDDIEGAPLHASCRCTLLPILFEL